jgi:hypothetical protein
MMQVFLNEKSLQGQFGSIGDFQVALIELNRVLARVIETPCEKRLYYVPIVFHSTCVGDQIFSGSLERVAEKSARFLFKRLLREQFASWVDSRTHEECPYMYVETNVCDSSLAELAERRLNDGIGFLLNFAPSTFRCGEVIEISKQGTVANIDLVCSQSEYSNWCGRQPSLGLVAYQDGRREPPSDEDTILRMRSRFSRTSLLNQGRAVYLERRTGRCFCVDNMHFGGAAHLEVFDASGSHIGEADLAGNVNSEKADPQKRLGG